MTSRFALFYKVEFGLHFNDELCAMPHGCRLILWEGVASWALWTGQELPQGHFRTYLVLCDWHCSRQAHWVYSSQLRATGGSWFIYIYIHFLQMHQTLQFIATITIHLPFICIYLQGLHHCNGQIEGTVLKQALNILGNYNHFQTCMTNSHLACRSVLKDCNIMDFCHPDVPHAYMASAPDLAKIIVYSGFHELRSAHSLS